MGLNSKYLTVSSKRARSSNSLDRKNSPMFLLFVYFNILYDAKIVIKKGFHGENFILVLSDMSK